jgi:hypothetical protein
LTPSISREVIKLVEKLHLENNRVMRHMRRVIR